MFGRLPIAVMAVSALATAAHAEDIPRAKLDEARSLIAEAAMIEQLLSQDKITQTYADAQREDVRQDLVKLKKEEGLAAAAQGALEALDRHDIAALRAIRDQLVGIERAHGRTG
jgi:hypothetical protein